MQAAEVTTCLLLVGGGHTHVQVLKAFGMHPEPGLRITLIAKELEAPYSGMLPGFVAGHYTHEDIHIDLVRLARFANARVIHGEMCGIDRAAKRVVLRGRPPLAYDILSLDVGITPDLGDIEGAREHAIAVKPVSTFAGRWAALEAAAVKPGGPRRIAVIGGGAAGAELVLAVRNRLLSRPTALLPDGNQFSFALISASELLASHNNRARQMARAALMAAGVDLMENTSVRAVEPGGVLLDDGRRYAADAVLLATKAAPPPWFRETGLPLSPRGFLALRPTLQLTGDDHIFAAGDCADVLEYPRPKAGVFAVRQGPPLIANLRCVMKGEAAKPFSPQREFLTLLSLGGKRAIATRGNWSVEGDWVWRWKDHIDRAFMAKFNELPEMTPDAGATAMRCGGCAAKVGPQPLAQALARLGSQAGDSSVVGLSGRDDAAVLDLGGDRLRVESVDFFRSFWADPYVFGEIAANHALNDVFAMGGIADHALAICVLPHGKPRKVEEDLYQVLAGARARFDADGVTLAGGHSSEGPELAAGFFVSGHVARERILKKGGLKPGDRLILTRPLGTGILFAAEMRGKATAAAILKALGAMRQSNKSVAEILLRHGATAATDVSGFGFAGHLAEMLTASDAAAAIQIDALPLYDEVQRLAEAGIVSTLLAENISAAHHIDAATMPSDAMLAVLFDPQTAGGLVAGIEAVHAQSCIDELRAGPAPQASLVGVVTPYDPAAKTGRLSIV